MGKCTSSKPYVTSTLLTLFVILLSLRVDALMDLNPSPKNVTYSGHGVGGSTKRRRVKEKYATARGHAVAKSINLLSLLWVRGYITFAFKIRLLNNHLLTIYDVTFHTKERASLFVKNIHITIETHAVLSTRWRHCQSSFQEKCYRHSLLVISSTNTGFKRDFFFQNVRPVFGLLWFCNLHSL
jgi:hypothetical protein